MKLGGFFFLSCTMVEVDSILVKVCDELCIRPFGWYLSLPVVLGMDQLLSS